MAYISPKECEIEGCHRSYYGKGCCQMHWQRLRKYGDPHGGLRNHAPPEERFFRRVRKTEECWFWEGKTGGGYGQFQAGGKGTPFIGAHRFSYEMHHGPVPEGLVVMHSCDTPLCVNPAHLSAGTYAQNTADMSAKGRRRGRTILTRAQVAEARASTEVARVIADRFGVSKSTIWAIRNGQNWKE